MSLERYLVISGPISSPKLSRKLAHLSMVIIWIFVIILALTPGIFPFPMKFPSKKWNFVKTCTFFGFFWPNFFIVGLKCDDTCFLKILLKIDWKFPVCFHENFIKKWNFLLICVIFGFFRLKSVHGHVLGWIWKFFWVKLII